MSVPFYQNYMSSHPRRQHRDNLKSVFLTYVVDTYISDQNLVILERAPSRPTARTALPDSSLSKEQKRHNSRIMRNSTVKNFLFIFRRPVTLLHFRDTHGEIRTKIVLKLLRVGIKYRSIFIQINQQFQNKLRQKTHTHKHTRTVHDIMTSFISWELI
jgi:hypothetical protein